MGEVIGPSAPLPEQMKNGAPTGAPSLPKGLCIHPGGLRSVKDEQKDAQPADRPFTASITMS